MRELQDFQWNSDIRLSERTFGSLILDSRISKAWEGVKIALVVLNESPLIKI